jgi:retinol dehydrogenase 14
VTGRAAVGPMAGRTVLVTGGTGGIGRATAESLAGLGADVALTGRDPERASRAAHEIGARTGRAVAVFLADLGEQAQVRRLAAEALDTLPRIDVLVNNVGGYWHTRATTPDGLERTFATNHLAPYLLTHLLLGRLREAPAARVVTVSSRAHALGRIDLEDLQGERSYSGARAYNQSKLANLLFTYELGRRLRRTGVVAHAVHPGVVRTSFGAEDPGGTQRLLVPLLRPFMQSPARGAATSTFVASSPEVGRSTGRYFVGGRARRSSPESYDEAIAARLWDLSADLCDVPSAGRVPRSAGPPRIR